MRATVTCVFPRLCSVCMLAKSAVSVEPCSYFTRFAWKSDFLHNTNGWERRFAQLVAFQQQHGHIGVTQNNETSPGLMHWRDNQRVKLRNGTLTPDCKARLDALGFDWQSPGRGHPLKV